MLDPHIVVHSKRAISTVSEQPAHIGWRHDRKTLTTMNRATGKVEQHQIGEKYPIYGNVQSVRIFFLKIKIYFYFF